MNYTIFCVGKIKEKFYSDAIKEYEKRLSKYGRIRTVEVPDERTPDRASEQMERQIREKEAARLLSRLQPGMYVIALDLRGQEYDSLAFSDHLETLKLHGKSHIAFVIGGSLGLHDSILRRADERICFSKMTFPHNLMRVILLEQLYRANRILNHEPYHK